MGGGEMAVLHWRLCIMFSFTLVTLAINLVAEAEFGGRGQLATDRTQKVV